VNKPKYISRETKLTWIFIWQYFDTGQT